MTEPGGRGRSVLRIPRVEFDLSALVLGAALAFAYAAVWGPLASLLSVDAGGAKILTAAGPRDVPPAVALRSVFFSDVQRAFPAPGLDRVLGLIGHPGPLVRASEKTANTFEPAILDVPVWKHAVVAAVLLVIWSVLGGALARTYALRKARDESAPVDAAVAFSLANLRQFVQAPLFTLAAGALFAALAAACGALAAVPWAGPVLQVVAQPLSLLAALVTAVIGLGLVLGFPMFTAAVAVERNGSLDAVSRTFSYVWTRPVTFGVSALLVVAVAGVIEVVAGWVLGLASGLFLLGTGIVDAGLAPKLAGAFRAAMSLENPPTDGLAAAEAASVWVGWGVAGVAGIVARGFVVSYLVGGIVDLYFILREEVDLIDPSEVYAEGDTASLGEPVGEPARAESGAAASPVETKPAP